MSFFRSYLYFHIFAQVYILNSVSLILYFPLSYSCYSYYVIIILYYYYYYYIVILLLLVLVLYDRLCGLVVRVLGYRSGGPGSSPGTTRKKVVGLERGPLSLLSTTEELLDKKVTAPV
jgi:hypothetical protein